MDPPSGSRRIGWAPRDRWPFAFTRVESMVVVVVVLAVLAMVELVLIVLTRRRLAAQRRLTAAADERAASLAVELAAVGAARAEAEQQRATAEKQRAEAAALAAAALDPQVLWSLERTRSERTWRISVAAGPDAASVLADAPHPLIEALQIELDATREEVGTIVALDADLPAEVTAAGSLLTLRVAQELLATVVRRAEETVLRVHAEGADIVVTVEATDENSKQVDVVALDIPSSPGVQQIEHGVRILNALIVGNAPPVDVLPDEST